MLPVPSAWARETDAAPDDDAKLLDLPTVASMSWQADRANPVAVVGCSMWRIFHERGAINGRDPLESSWLSRCKDWSG